GTTTGTDCYAYVVPGKNPRTSRHLASDGNPVFLDPTAFAQPCQLQATTADPTGASAPIANSPEGCVPLTGLQALGGLQPSQVAGPGFHRVDFSLFKNFQ